MNTVSLHSKVRRDPIGKTVCLSSSFPVSAIYPSQNLSAVILHALGDLVLPSHKQLLTSRNALLIQDLFPCKHTAQARQTNTGLLSQDKRSNKKVLHNPQDMRITHQNNHEYPISAALPHSACFFPVSYQCTEARTQ